MCNAKIPEHFFIFCDMVVTILVTWWECWQKLHMNPKVMADIEQWAVCVTVFLCFLQMLQFPPTVQTQIGLVGDPFFKLLVVVSVSGKWVCTVMTATLDLSSFFTYVPKWDLRLYSICILSRLLTSLTDTHRNKLLIDLLCSLSCHLTAASQIFYFLFSFFFFSLIKAPSYLSFTLSRSICWGQMLWFFSFTSGRENIQGWKARYLQWISVAAQGLASAAAPHRTTTATVTSCFAPCPIYLFIQPPPIAPACRSLFILPIKINFRSKNTYSSSLEGM